ncbi:MAG: 30S ribosomal protein S16 [Planctomycetes bacterium]|nr:30S ribosomal protein S16 [Planctomycetota bacterium]HRV81970.1 30S ribosomal protein S16 [Planctomycetota bacterium]
MAVVIRMKRTGRKNRPCYRISVADSRAPRDGRTLETLGLYDPVAPSKDAQIRLDVERARHWLSSGALPSETVRSIFKRTGVYVGFAKPKPKRDRSGRKANTQTSARRVADKTMRSERKQARSKARVAAKRQAAKAAAQPAAE